MELKTFRSGIEYVVKGTNQRLGEPEPLMVQIGADSMLSFLSGNKDTVFIWRTGEKMDAPRQRFGIPSKMMSQAIKALKGTKLSVSFSVTDDGLTVLTSSGGAINLPKVDEPDIMRPFSSGENSPAMSLRKGTLARWSDAFTTAFSPTEDSVQFDIDGRVSATDGYIMFDTHGTLDSNLAERRHVRASFWNALRQLKNDATLTFSQSGLRVQSGEYEALASFLEGQRIYPDLKQHFYPDGKTPKLYCVVDKKVFIANIKAVASTNGKEQIFLSLPLRKDQDGLVIKGLTSNVNVVMETKVRTNSWGTIECNAGYLVSIMNAIDGNRVIISWRDNKTHPLGIRDVQQQHEWFLLAPVVRD